MLRRLAAAVTCVLLLAAVPTGSLYVTTLPTGPTSGSTAPTWAAARSCWARWRPPAIRSADEDRPDPLQLDVSVIANQTTLSSTRLQPAHSGPLHPLPGWIAIHGEVRTAYVDGHPAVPAKDGTILVAAGTHELSARTPRGRITRSVMVWPGTRRKSWRRTRRRCGPASSRRRRTIRRGAIRVEGEKVVVRYGGHEVIGHIGSTAYRVDGKTVDYGEAPR